MIVLVAPGVAFAEGGSALYIPVGAGLAMGLAALGGTLGQGKAIASGLDSIGRNPSAAGKITTPMYVGLAFVESLVIISFALGFLLKNLYA
jgi:F-type H+-transporting ATPase subunit c